ncbi:MAG: pyruvate kinase [Candidatus Andersenbacteria bacterium]
MGVSVIEHNRTKIVCTIGPASSSAGILKEMIVAGMDVARINFSHSDHEGNLELIEKIRQAAKAMNRTVAILQDLQGPKLRVGTLPEDGLELLEGQIATLQAGVIEASPGIIPVPYDRFAHDLRRGDRILLVDGTRELEVLEVKGSIVKAKVLLGGRLISHKGMNVPTVSLSMESMTEKDEQDLVFGLKHDIDFIALSFVRSAEDVKKLKGKIKEYLPAGAEPPHIIVKIEKHEALRNFDEILEETDGVMIARGDLGLETPVTRVPIHQKELIAKCVVAGKPVITATEMLGSMEHNPRPTRAEVSDVANAVIDHTDAVMLSGETAMGRYPVRAVQIMAEVIEHTEETPLDDLLSQKHSTGQPVPLAVGAAAVELARRIDAAAILITTKSGYSARAVAKFRPEIPIFAATNNPRTRNQLLLSWGITSFIADDYTSPQRMVELGLKELAGAFDISSGSKIVVISGLRRDNGGYNSGIQVIEV